MDMKLLEELCLAFGPSGDEKEVRDIIISRIRHLCDSLKIDRSGNLIAFRRGKQRPKNRLLFTAHTDEVGFMITGAEKSGHLNFATLGGMDSRVLPGRRVAVGEKRLPGVISSKPIHLISKDERKEAFPVEKLYIDIGASSKDEALTFAPVGTFATFKGDFIRFGENDVKIKSKALDDRVGCALLVGLLENELPYDLTVAFTTNEETGCRGSRTAAFASDADICLVVEGTTAADISGVTGAKRVCVQSEGGVIGLADNGTLYDMELYRELLKRCGEKKIKIQTKTLVAGGNDARSLQRARTGSRVASLSAPCRYIHSASSVVDIRDLQEMEKALFEALCLFANI